MNGELRLLDYSHSLWQGPHPPSRRWLPATLIVTAFMVRAWSSSNQRIDRLRATRVESGVCVHLRSESEAQRMQSESTPGHEAREHQASGKSHRRLVAVYPGSFDPVHKGHLDIARRAANITDELIVAVYKTPSKNLMFSTEERIDLWRGVIAEAGLPNVRVESFEGLIVEFARKAGAQAIVRGLRAVTDFEYEFQQALMNRKQAPEIETLMIITALPHLFISSSLLKEVAKLHGDLDGIVTPGVARALHDRLGFA